MRTAEMSAGGKEWTVGTHCFATLLECNAVLYDVDTLQSAGNSKQARRFVADAEFLRF